MCGASQMVFFTGVLHKGQERVQESALSPDLGRSKMPFPVDEVNS